MNKNSKIAILGYGVEGRSTEKYLLKHGYKNICVLDEKTEIQTESKSILGKQIWNSLEDFDVIFRSPGISPLRTELQNVEKKGIKINSHTEMFFDKCPAKIIGVTGTKGKGTTSSLLFDMLQRSKRKSFLGGNIGNPPLDFLDEVKSDDLVVLELSSFQTFTLKKSPQIAVVLMVTQEHLDYHKNIFEYQEAKAQLVINQSKDDICIYHKDFEGSRNIAATSQAQKIDFSPKTDIRNGELFLADEAIIKTKDIGLLGEHNWNNVLAAALTAKSLGVEREVIRKSIKEFKGLPLRLEQVKEKNGVIFINDSFSTTPETTLAALQSFPKQNIAVMLGGSSKGSDFSVLGDFIRKNSNIFAICYGDTGKNIYKNIDSKKQSLLIHSFEKAFNMAFEYIKKTGGVLLLSPACASFDEFPNYKKRGEVFNSLISNVL